MVHLVALLNALDEDIEILERCGETPSRIECDSLAFAACFSKTGFGICEYRGIPVMHDVRLKRGLFRISSREGITLYHDLAKYMPDEEAR